MRILLLGEYSKLHNTLKEGLLLQGHKVLLLGDGDGFKNFPVDISIKANWLDTTFLKYFKIGLFKVFGTDISKLERGIRCYISLRKLKGFDVVQLINEKPFKTYPWLERRLLKRIFSENKKVVLLSCGADYTNVNYYLHHPKERSWLTPMVQNPALQKRYAYVFDFLKKGHQKTHQLIFEAMDAVIATDFDYVPPLEGHPKFKGLIPNPVIIPENSFHLSSEGKVHILLGINRWNYHTKGISFFEEALKVIQQKYASEVVIDTTENLPYSEYINHMKNAHILLDQVYAKDQGYNALEAMAMGKVVFTGADKAFLKYYGLEEDTVCINALPNVSYLVEKLEMLIEDRALLVSMSNNARSFVQKQHAYQTIAKWYEKVYKGL